MDFCSIIGTTLRSRIIPQNIPVAGIDVSKAKSDFCILDTANNIIRRGVVQHTHDSMTAFLKIISDASEKLGAKPIFIMEATAHYHRILYKQLVDNGYTVIVINPIQSGSIRNMSTK